MEVKYPQITVKLTGHDGNAFAIIGKMCSAIRKELGKDFADEFREEAFKSKSYDDLLALCMKTVRVI